MYFFMLFYLRLPPDERVLPLLLDGEDDGEELRFEDPEDLKLDEFEGFLVLLELLGENDLTDLDTLLLVFVFGFAFVPEL